MNLIYHSSYKVVDEPSIIKGKYTKDFGEGFYCTEEKSYAEKHAKIYKTPVINIYSLKDISDLKVKVFHEYNEEWLDFVIHCRNGGTHSYDVVKGFTADDTIYEDMAAYLSGNINKKCILDMMKSNWNKTQISFHSERALSKIVFLEVENMK